MPAIDQTRNVGIVTLPGTFVGLVLGGASPAEAARIQLTVLLTLLAVELLSRDGDRGADRAHPHRPGRAPARRCRAMFDGDFDRDAERLTAKLDGFADDPDGLRDAFLRATSTRSTPSSPTTGRPGCAPTTSSTPPPSSSPG